MGKVDAKGRSKGDGRHIRLYHYLWPAIFERLDGSALKALFYMLTFEEGDNNGEIFVGARILADGIGVDKKRRLGASTAWTGKASSGPRSLDISSKKAVQQPVGASPSAC